MPKFYGKIGYRLTVRTGPGVSEEIISERVSKGDIVRNSRKLEEGVGVNSDISMGYTVELVGDAYATQNFTDILFVEWMGKPWVVVNVDIEAPRLKLRLGGLYNGTRAPEPSDGEPGGDETPETP